ncbi:glycosyltransferase family 2 protein [Flavobacterium sp. CYK-4]|uniref:glycosyltransferase family 2 protein n=1 Tax=Flavobacterium lotistagni TaxID=2709660 RepID=UPI0014079E8E|nr:glycosyltransferase family A protein [Flavobacterium lotistagni]NHM07017.1 glycosyltransferase family 2 protein [Flavobacterium lotistagni]
MPQFSVIIPVYNKERFIENTIHSVLQQSFTDFELILINDGSTDQSEAKIKTFTDSRIRYFSTPNQGVSLARNLGVEKSTASYITFLDADDYWFTDFLQEMKLMISQHPDEKIFAAAIEVETPEGVVAAPYSISKNDGYHVLNYFQASMKTTIICTSCAVFDKDFFNQTGGFDAKIRSGQDTDLWIRMGLRQKVVFIQKILARYVYDQNSLSKKKEFHAQRMDFQKFAEAEKTNLALRKFLDLNRYALAIRSRLYGDEINFNQLKKDLALENLTFRKRILLSLPGFALRFLLSVNQVLRKLGWSQSVFK